MAKTHGRQPAVVHYELKPGAVELREVDIPAIGANDVLLRVGAVGVCGSDVHQAYNTHSWPVNIPVILGHEFAGTISATGAAVNGFSEGDRVVSETAADICGRCLPCRSGRYNLCTRRKGFGYGVDGAMTQFVKVPARCLHRVPDELPFDKACLTEPCAVAYHAVCVNAVIRPGDAVVILGPGPIGLLCARLSALSGAMPLFVIGMRADTERLRIARTLGASACFTADDGNMEEELLDLTGGGADVVVDASGSTRALETAIRLARPDGQVVKVGWSPQQTPVDLNPLVQKNLRLQGSFSHNYAMWEKVIALLASGRMKVETLTNLKTGLEGWHEAFAAMHAGTAIKPVLKPFPDEGKAGLG